MRSTGMNRLPGIIALLLFVIFCAGCARKAHDELVVGMDLSYPPFEKSDTSGNPSGVSVDLANALGEFLHRKVVVRNIRFDGLIPELKTGGIDLIISSMTATPKRAEEIDFSDPYLKTGLCLLVGAKSPVQSIDDVDKPGRSVVVKKGTTGQLYAADHIKNANVVVLDEEAACVLDVVQGKEDAFIYDQMSTYQNYKNNPDTTRAILTPIDEESWAIGIRKGNDALRTQVNQFLADYKAKGGFDALGDKYLAEQKAAFKKMGIPFYF
ncbi:MAG TPA: transporter substrate-binding domain-containing protein [Chthoniobacteraceae bacterium]|nr:transporter substrate-binding domain-containing protein [Chthoniobacteraceae bacterium]